MTQFQGQAEAKSLRLSVRDQNPELQVRTDPRRLRQILQNLLSNALKFTESGSIEIWTTAQDHTVQIAVKDTGKGLKSKDQEKIFESFERLYSDVCGTGLGLTIARRLSELMGGTLVAESPGEGLGTTFTVTLPGVK